METPLSCMYLMPNTQTASNNQTDQTLVEKWKGPWSQIRHITDPKNSSIFGVKLLPGMARPTELSGGDAHWKAEFAAPKASTTDADIVWVIQDVKATEIVAGELGEVEITYRGVSNGSGGGVGDGFVNTRPTTWTLTWGSTQVSPLAYCIDETGCRATEIMECIKNPHPSLMEIWTYYKNQEFCSANTYYYWTGTDDIGKSIGYIRDSPTGHGKEIYDYMQKDVRPMFHYPILERKEFIKEAPAVTSADYKKMQPRKLSALNRLDRVDYMTPEVIDPDSHHVSHKLGDIPEGCPYGGRNLSAYKWVCVEDNYIGTFNGTYSYERTTKWWGSQEVDKNFYGPDGTRWEFPKVQEVSAINN